MQISVNGAKLNRWYVYCYIELTGEYVFLGIFDTWLSLKDFWDILTKIYKQKDVFVREKQIEESATMVMATATESAGLAAG